MERTTTAVTPERYASGMTFERYLQYVASPENLGREGGANGERRRDWSGWMRSWYDSVRLTEPQADAIRWLVSQWRKRPVAASESTKGSSTTYRADAEVRRAPGFGLWLRHFDVRPRPQAI